MVARASRALRLAPQHEKRDDIPRRLKKKVCVSDGFGLRALTIPTRFLESEKADKYPQSLPKCTLTGRRS